MALEFVAADDTISFGDQTLFDGATNMTWAFWLKLTTSASGEMVMRRQSASAGWTIRSGASAANRFGFYTRSASSDKFGWFSHTAASEWHHYTVVYDGSGSANADRVKIYLDAALQTLTFSGTTTATLVSAAGSNMVVGDNGVANDAMSGQLADLKIWNVSLTADELANEMRTRRPQRTSGLQMWVPCDDAVIPKEYSGNARHATSSAADLVAGPPNTYGG